MHYFRYINCCVAKDSGTETHDSNGYQAPFQRSLQNALKPGGVVCSQG